MLGFQVWGFRDVLWCFFIVLGSSVQAVGL